MTAMGAYLERSGCNHRTYSACGKTLDANHSQLLAGMGWWFRHYAKQQSPEDRGRYESVKDEVKARRLGLWSELNPIQPHAGVRVRGSFK